MQNATTVVARQDKVTFWRYHIPSDGPLGGWGIFLLDSTGMFTAVTDYGNYAFKWHDWGPSEFRTFVQSLEPDYVCGKLGSRNKLQAKETVNYIKELIISRRREGDWPKETARREWNLIKDKNFLDLEDQQAWYYNSMLGGDPDIFRYDFDASLKCFGTKLLPRLQEAIRQQLREEQYPCRECDAPSGRRHAAWCLKVQ